MKGPAAWLLFGLLAGGCFPDRQLSDQREQPATSAGRTAPVNAAGRGGAGAAANGGGGAGAGAGAPAGAGRGSAGSASKGGTGGQIGLDGMRTFAAGSGGAGAGGAGAGGAGSGAGSGGMPAAGTGALAGAGAGGGGGSGGGSCFEWKTVADLLHTPEDPTDGSWPAGEETLQSPGKSVQQYICLGAPGASPPSVGKAVYTYGCYVPRGDKPFKDTTDIQILVSRNPTCLDWAPLLNGQLPANVQRLGTPSDSVPVCHAAHTGMTPEGLMSTGVHVGEAVPIGNSFNCRFEFYDTLLTVADFEVLVRKSP